MAEAGSLPDINDIVTGILEQIHAGSCRQSLQLLLKTGCFHVPKTDFTRPTLTALFLMSRIVLFSGLVASLGDHYETANRGLSASLVHREEVL
jgi:hypothetical protein